MVMSAKKFIVQSRPNAAFRPSRRAKGEDSSWRRMPEQNGTRTTVDHRISFKGGEQTNHHIDIDAARRGIDFDCSFVLNLTDPISDPGYGISISTVHLYKDLRR